MKKITKKIVIASIISIASLSAVTGFSSWVINYLKNESNTLSISKLFTVQFYDQNKDLIDDYTISGLEIDTWIELPRQQDYLTQNFVGWTDATGSNFYNYGSLCVSELVFDASNTAKIYEKYETTTTNVQFNITANADISTETYSQIVRVIDEATPFYLFNLNPNSLFFGNITPAYKLVSYTYSDTETYSINSSILLNADSFPNELGENKSRIINFYANYEAI